MRWWGNGREAVAEATLAEEKKVPRRELFFFFAPRKKRGANGRREMTKVERREA